MSDWTICNGCGQRIPAFDYAHACPAQTGAAVIVPSASRTVMVGDSQPSELDRLRKENAALREALERISNLTSEEFIFQPSLPCRIARAALQGAKDD